MNNPTFASWNHWGVSCWSSEYQAGRYFVCGWADNAMGNDSTRVPNNSRDASRVDGMVVGLFLAKSWVGFLRATIRQAWRKESVRLRLAFKLIHPRPKAVGV